MDSDVVLHVGSCRCMYKLGFDAYAKRSKKQAQPIMDIEELVTTMKEKTVSSGQTGGVVAASLMIAD